MNNQKIFAGLFFLSVIGNLAGHAFNIDIIVHLSKPLLMIFLALYFVFSIAKNQRNRAFYFTLAALFFSWLGDNFLMFSSINSIYFMLGLAAFGLAQLTYSINFQLIKSSNKTTFNFLTLVWIVIVIIYSINIWKRLNPFLGEYMIPVTAYLVVISLMAISAGSRYKKAPTSSFILCYTGALVFMISDTIIALNKWYSPISNERILVMATYLLAQWMIVNGIIMYFRSTAIKEA